jgi:radical SAM superfamily enzyme YgiQ (UPF0313 family)
MRVLLVKPPIRACRIEIGRHVPIGLAYLASALRDDGHEVAILDALSFTEDNHIVSPHDYTAADKLKIRHHPRWKHLVHWGASWQRLERHIRAAQPDVVGISCMFTPYYETAYQTARLVRRVVPKAFIVFGGQHPTVAHHHAIQERAFDLIVRGEGEQTLAAALAAYQAGENLTSINGLAFYCGAGLCSCDPPADKVHLTSPRANLEDLDILSIPATDLIDFSRYENATTLITSRGCPFSCTFCTVHATVGKKFRARAPYLVIEEIRHYVDVHNVRQFRIEDDNFTFDPARVAAICHELEKSNLDVELYLPNGITALNLSYELVRQMVRAGFKGLFLGLETTDPADLRRLRKGFTSLEKIQAASAWFGKEGASVSASLIVGLLDHDISSIALDVARLTLAGIPYGSNPFYPIPGSADYARCLGEGVVNPDTEMALFDGFNFACGSNVLSPEEMYWAWIYAQAVSFWPEYVLGEPGRRGSDEEADISFALQDLVQAQRLQSERDDRFEILAEPAEASGNRVAMSQGGCFCQRQNVRELREGGGPADFCTVAGDLTAAAVGLYRRTPVSAMQVNSAVRNPGGHCTFALMPGTLPTPAHVQQEFERALQDVNGRPP